MIFKKGNGIRVHFDFCHYYNSIPSGVDFDIKDDGDFYTLRAHGYGLHGKEDSYGSGALHVLKSDILRAFEKGQISIRVKK